MGIQGLIPFLDKVSSRINISQYSGCCMAVDAYCWLHKGAYTCAEKLANGEKCDAYIWYCMKYVNLLLSFNIKPILVFDGRHLPAKAGTEKKRRESREINRKTATDLLNAGRVDEARTFLRRCVDVTHTMALALIKECRKNNVDCIVAPYEADAQLAYLNLQNIAHVVITEDSDLILFGCSKVIFKLDLQGYGLLVERERLHLSMGIRAENFCFDRFRHMCILSGCDYLPSLPGIGLNKALKFIKKTKDPDIYRALRRLPAYLNMTQLRVSDEYRDAFLAADATFRYQPVFDPRLRSVVSLTMPPEGEDPVPIVKEHLPQSVAFNLALGNLDPFTLKEVDNFDPDCTQHRLESSKKRCWASTPAVNHPSIWSPDYPSYESKQVKKQFPSNLNCSAILNVTSLRVLKRSVTAAVQESTALSHSELESMYGKSDPQLPKSKKLCLSAEENDFVKQEVKSKEFHSSELHTESLVTTVASESLQNSTSPVLSQRKSCNPFVKPKHTQLMACGPLSARSHFSALQKFDEIILKEADTSFKLVSRCHEIDLQKQADSCAKEDKNVFMITSNADLKHPLEDTRTSCSEYTPGANNLSNLQQKTSSSPKFLPRQINSFAESTDSSPTESHTKETDTKFQKEYDVGFGHAIKDHSSEQGNKTIENKKLVSSFNWSQFICKNLDSTSKFYNSGRVKKTFKNPAKKQNITKCGSLDTFLNERQDLEHQSSFLCSSESKSGDPNMNSSPLHTDITDGLDQQVQLSGESTDSGYQDLLGIDSKNTAYETCLRSSTTKQSSSSLSSSSIADDHAKGLYSGRRLGMGHFSPCLSLKQNFLSQYGFSKKKKLI